LSYYSKDNDAQNGSHFYTFNYSHTHYNLPYLNQTDSVSF